MEPIPHLHAFSEYFLNISRVSALSSFLSLFFCLSSLDRVHEGHYSEAGDATYDAANGQFPMVRVLGDVLTGDAVRVSPRRWLCKEGILLNFHFV